MKKVIVVLGATATGKSNLAVYLAKKFNGEVISADSRQIYKYMDIGTGKITKKEMKGVPHHLIDIIHPKKTLSVALYKKLANEKIEEIIDKGKTPIICGGTGFYIDAVVDGMIFPKVKENKKLRKELEKKEARELFDMLKKLDKARAENIDAKNKIRLIRAIEIAKILGRVPKIKKEKAKYEFIKIGVQLPQEELNKKIEKRVKKMFKDGLLTEIENLKKKGVTKNRLVEFGFEYNNPKEESVVRESIKYSKRQKTWWKRDKKIKWFSPTLRKEILEYLKKSF
jgi:tRNA dimethylallyltransferase